MKLKKWINQCSNRTWFCALGVSAILISNISFGIHYLTTEKKVLTCKAIPLETGYGYIIGTHKQDTLIYQPYIPAVEQRMPFKTVNSALAVASEVCRKIEKTGSATITKAEVLDILSKH